MKGRFVRFSYTNNLFLFTYSMTFKKIGF